jgi:purine nucleosidase
MPSARILLDCDPGLDDALALVLCHGDPGLDLVAVTTVGGNVPLAATTRNALELRDHLGFPSVPVAAGAGAPLVRPAENAAHVHGDSGLGSVELAPAVTALDPRSAVDLIVDAVRSAPGEIHLVATGPLTNIALALQKDPAIVGLVASIVVMGGSYTRGNATPAAEFNVFADPEAAAIVFGAGWRVVMVGLDLTLQAIATPPIVARMRALGRLGTELLAPLSTFWVDPTDAAFPGQAVHDVCAAVFVSRPDLFETRDARVEVETEGRLTSGMTVVDFSSAAPNARVAVRLDVDAFWDHVLGAYERVTVALDA